MLSWMVQHDDNKVAHLDNSLLHGAGHDNLSILMKG